MKFYPKSSYLAKKEYQALTATPLLEKEGFRLFQPVQNHLRSADVILEHISTRMLMGYNFTTFYYLSPCCYATTNRIDENNRVCSECLGEHWRLGSSGWANPFANSEPIVSWFDFHCQDPVQSLLETQKLLFTLEEFRLRWDFYNQSLAE